MTPAAKNNDPLDAILRRATRAQPGPATPECADAESLAAYSDRSLAAADRDRLETHFADCMRCQLLLADIARAEESARGAEAASEVPWYRRWRIAIPALAAVAAVLVFIAIKRPATEEPHSDQLVAMAKNEAPRMERAEQAPAPAPSAQLVAPTSPAAAPARDEIAMNESNAKGEPAKSAHMRMHHAAPPPMVAPQSPAAAPVPPPVEAGRVVAIAPAAPAVEPGPAAVGQPTASVSGALAINQPQLETLQRAESGYVARQRNIQAATAGNSGMIAAPEGAAPAIAGAAAGSGQPQTYLGAGRAEKLPPGLPQGGLPLGGWARGAALPRDKSVTWLVGKNGVIQKFYANGAMRWQYSGVTTDLLTGWAPSATVCWVVGSSGTIIRTTDGGDHWERITAPSADNLRMVVASSAKDATITTERGRSFVTSDGGATWHQQ